MVKRGGGQRFVSANDIETTSSSLRGKSADGVFSLQRRARLGEIPNTQIVIETKDVDKKK
jgi:hypothetical protein